MKKPSPLPLQINERGNNEQNLSQKMEKRSRENDELGGHEALDESDRRRRDAAANESGRVLGDLPCAPPAAASVRLLEDDVQQPRPQFKSG